MDLRIAIVDDRQADRERLKTDLGRFFALQGKDRPQIDSYSSAEAMLPAFEPGLYQLAFLDIVMDEMTGIELARRLRAADAQLLIVFQTTSREYAFDAFPIHPFDYLIKPYDERALHHTLKEAMRVIRAADPEIQVTSARESYDVPLRTICAAVSSGHNVELMLESGRKLVCSETFRRVSEKLSGDPRFLEINRGVLINMDQVLAPTDGGMKLKDGSLFPIRVNGRAAVLSAFSQYMISRVDGR